jgi:cyanate permease
MVMAPIAYFLIRNKPEDVGLWPDDMKLNLHDFGSLTDTADNGDWTVKEALRTRSFWLLLLCMMIPSAIITGMVFHQVSIMDQVGLTPKVAALVLSTMAIVRLPVALVAGQVADRVPVGSALGPLPYGFAYDIFGSYSQALTVSMIFPLIGIAAALLAKPPVKMVLEET